MSRSRNRSRITSRSTDRGRTKRAARTGDRWCYEGWLKVRSRRRGMDRQEGRGEDAGDQGLELAVRRRGLPSSRREG